MKRVAAIAVMLVTSLSFCLPAVHGARGETVLDRLQKASAEQPQASIEQICAAAEKDARLAKCRGHYLSDRYLVEWRGEDKNTAHPIPIEVLVRGDAAVLCHALPNSQLDDWSPCIALQRNK